MLCKTFFITEATDTDKLVKELELIKHPTNVKRAVHCIQRMRGVVEAQLCPLYESADALEQTWGVTVDVDSVRKQLIGAVWDRWCRKIQAFIS